MGGSMARYVHDKRLLTRERLNDLVCQQGHDLIQNRLLFLSQAHQPGSQQEALQYIEQCSCFGWHSQDNATQAGIEGWMCRKSKKLMLLKLSAAGLLLIESSLCHLEIHQLQQSR